MQFPYDEPGHIALYEEILGCPLVFNAEHCAVLLSPKAMSSPLVTSQPQLAEICKQHCNQLLQRLQGKDEFIDAVQEIIVSATSRTPLVDEVATQLGLSSRTFRRKLQQRSTTYQTILNRVRAELATDYLSNSDLTIDQIAAIIGFSETTTFRSAFKKWTGNSAAKVRRDRN